MQKHSHEVERAAETLHELERTAEIGKSPTTPLILLGDVWVVATKGGTARQLTTNPARDAEPRFSPDGKAIAFVSYRLVR